MSHFDFLGRPLGLDPARGGFPALARDEAAFFGDVRDAIIPMILPAPHLQMGQDSTWARKTAMSHEPSASSIPMAVGSAPQKSLNMAASQVGAERDGGGRTPVSTVYQAEAPAKKRAGDKKSPAILPYWAAPFGKHPGEHCRGGLFGHKPQSLKSQFHNFLLRPTLSLAVCGVVEYNINLSVRFVKKKVKLFLDIFIDLISTRNCMVFVY